jgi:hypothetical protein
MKYKVVALFLFFCFGGGGCETGGLEMQIKRNIRIGFRTLLNASGGNSIAGLRESIGYCA